MRAQFESYQYDMNAKIKTINDTIHELVDANKKKETQIKLINDKLTQFLEEEKKDNNHDIHMYLSSDVENKATDIEYNNLGFPVIFDLDLTINRAKCQQKRGLTIYVSVIILALHPLKWILTTLDLFTFTIIYCSFCRKLEKNGSRNI